MKFHTNSLHFAFDFCFITLTVFEPELQTYLSLLCCDPVILKFLEIFSGLCRRWEISSNAESLFTVTIGFYDYSMRFKEFHCHKDILRRNNKLHT